MGKSEEENVIIPGSGNVFAEMGLANPGEHLNKARLVRRILYSVEARGWTTGQAAAALSLSEAEASRLAVCRLKGFSVADLTELLALVERNS